MSRRRVLFLGAGHAHLHALQHLARVVEAGHEAVVIAPGPFWYSGLATAVLSGRTPPEQDRIDVAALVRRAGGTFVEGFAARICPGARTVHLRDGSAVPYDVLSLALGSETRALPGADAGVYPVKPIGRLWDLHLALRALGADGRAAPLRVLVAGAGMTGCEVAANVLALAGTLPRPVQVIVAARREALPGLPSALAGCVTRLLRARGAEIRANSPVAGIEGGVAVLGADRVPFDVLVNATGLVPPALIRESGLAVDAAGGLVVDAQLRSPSDPSVHGGGDCVAFGGRALPRAGVFGVRQAPVLFDNLLAALGLGRARDFRPQGRYLWIMNMGDGTGVASWGGLHFHGRPALWVKDWIDLRFVRRFAR